MDLSLSLKKMMDRQKVEEAVDGVWQLLLVWDLGPCLCWRVDEIEKYCLESWIFKVFNLFYLYLPLNILSSCLWSGLLILWLHNLLVNTNWMKSGIGNIVLNDLKQRKKLCSVVSQSIFLQYFQNDHCIKQKMVTTLYIFKICVNSEWHFQDYGIVKYHWLRWLSKNNICEICSCAHPLNSPVGMHVFSHL